MSSYLSKYENTLSKMLLGICIVCWYFNKTNVDGKWYRYMFRNICFVIFRWWVLHVVLMIPDKSEFQKWYLLKANVKQQEIKYLWQLYLKNLAVAKTPVPVTVDINIKFPVNLKLQPRRHTDTLIFTSIHLDVFKDSSFM